MSIFTNLEDLKQELEEVAAKSQSGLHRIGTGEFIDSLVFDHITGFSKELIPLFVRHKGLILELKTKTNHIDNLLELDPKGKIVVSWSLNPAAVIAREEPETTSLKERLIAGQKCQAQGYWIGLHFDPIIYDDNWQNEYEDLVKLTFSRLDPKRVIWISLGGLRFIPALVPKIKEMFPHSKIICGELFPGRDGKLRYLQKIRVALYTELITLIREFAPQAFIYLCMETREVWTKVFGWSPKDNSHLARLFTQRYYDI
jgi:spore photoproduct lyase